MNSADYLALDGRALKILLTVLEEGSVSAAAVRLEMSQPAVSHALDRLREIFGDPLFVKAGRGIRPTAHAHALGERARVVLDDLRALTVPPRFEPGAVALHFTLAANDYQRDLLLPGLLRRLRAQAPRLSISVIPSGIPSPQQLRSDRCDLILSPYPPEAEDILQKRLFSDRSVCFYDPQVRQPPRTLAEYLAAQHIALMFNEGERGKLDDRLQARGMRRQIALTVPNFSGVAPFLRGSDLLATLPSLLRHGSLSDLAWVAPPFELEPLTLYMLWHRRNQLDPAHQWLREALEQTAAELASGAA